jgi:hypothetical protein
LYAKWIVLYSWMVLRTVVWCTSYSASAGGAASRAWPLLVRRPPSPHCRAHPQHTLAIARRANSRHGVDSAIATPIQQPLDTASTTTRSICKRMTFACTQRGRLRRKKQGDAVHLQARPTRPLELPAVHSTRIAPTPPLLHSTGIWYKATRFSVDEHDHWDAQHQHRSATAWDRTWQRLPTVVTNSQ